MNFRVFAAVAAVLTFCVGYACADQKKEIIPPYPQSNVKNSDIKPGGEGSRDPGPPAGMAGAAIINPVTMPPHLPSVSDADSQARSPLPPGGKDAIPQFLPRGIPMMTSGDNTDSKSPDDTANGGNITSTPAASPGSPSQGRPADVKSGRRN